MMKNAYLPKISILVQLEISPKVSEDVTKTKSLKLWDLC